MLKLLIKRYTSRRALHEFIFSSANPNVDTNFFAQTLVLAFPDGKVMWVPPSHFKASCVMDLTYWPYDIHNCSVKFGSWVYSGVEVDFLLMDNKPKVRRNHELNPKLNFYITIVSILIFRIKYLEIDSIRNIF